MSTLRVFISGNRSITRITDKVSDLINDIINNNLELSNYDDVAIITGDASGVDTLIQDSCSDSVHVTVYYSGKEPRNLNGSVSESVYVPAHGNTGREWHSCKDRAMGNDCDVHIGLIETVNKQLLYSGTRTNHNYVTSLGKPSYLISATIGELIDL